MSDEREDLAQWLESSSRDDVPGAAQGLMKISHRLCVEAALAGLRALLGATDVKDQFEPDHLQRASRVAEAIERWLAHPDAAHLNAVRECTGSSERLWNELAGDSGQPEPLLECATTAGWATLSPEQRFNLTPSLNGAATLLGKERVLAAVRAELSKRTR